MYTCICMYIHTYIYIYITKVLDIESVIHIFCKFNVWSLLLKCLLHSCTCARTMFRDSFLFNDTHHCLSIIIGVKRHVHVQGRRVSCQLMHILKRTIDIVRSLRYRYFSR